MNKLKVLIASFVLLPFLFGSLALYAFLKPDFSKAECEAIRKNLNKIQLGMSKEEVLLILKQDEIESIVYPTSLLFPEQKSQWEFWLLCADLNSCIVEDSGKEQCYEWHMLAFDSKTEKVIKVFSDSPERIGFV